MTDGRSTTVGDLRFGLIVQTELMGGDRDTRQRVRELREQVAVARQCGFDGIGVGHHHSIGRTQRLHPVVLGAALADQAEGMDFASLVYLAGQYHPLEIAEQIATLDAIWDGRFKFGVAPGWVEDEFRALGLEHKRRLRRFLECIEVVQALWTGEPLVYEGEFFQLDGVQLCHLPSTPQGPKIWLGASAAKAARRVADLGFSYLLSGHPKISDLEVSLQAYRDRLDELGRPDSEDRPILRNCFVAQTDAEAVRIAAPHLQESYQGFAAWGIFEDVLGEKVMGQNLRDAPEPDMDAFRGDRVLIGSPDTVRMQLHDLIDRLDVNYLFLRLQWPGLDHSAVLEGIEMVGSEVLPAVREARTGQ